MSKTEWDMESVLPMAENSTFMNMTLNGASVSRMETDGFLSNQAERVFYSLLFTATGSAFCLANIFLVLYFTRKKQFTKTTFIFLCNLGKANMFSRRILKYANLCQLPPLIGK